eukprot:GHVN01096385.1.p1 GENE.GHVN01096385.1~~GHVN01096385.1.p1  ORF type:complete len:1213 (+),score=232.61 GHVN01096385.1:264-3902(+)
MTYLAVSSVLICVIVSCLMNEVISSPPRRSSRPWVVRAPSELPQTDRSLQSLDTEITFADRTYHNITQTFRDLAAQYPDLVDVTTAQERYPDVNLTAKFFTCGQQPCETLIVQLGHRPSLSQTTPEVFFSGALHGDERVGPNALTELSVFLVTNFDKIDAVTYLMKHRSIWIMPTTNAWGYHRVQRLENQIDPNRDFPYLKKPNECMETIMARAVNELFRERLFQMAVTFHGGMTVLSYEWGSYDHAHKNEKGRHGFFGEQWTSAEAPDDAAMAALGNAFAVSSGEVTTGKLFYPVGPISNFVYPVNGGMEDWAYAASFAESPIPITVCEPRTYGGYPREKTIYHKDNVRAMIFLVETSPRKDPPPEEMGTFQSFLHPTRTDGHIPRNMRLAYTVIELTEPNTLVRWIPEGPVIPGSDVSMGVYAVGCLTVNEIKVLAVKGECNRDTRRKVVGLSGDDAGDEVVMVGHLNEHRSCRSLALWDALSDVDEEEARGLIRIPVKVPAGDEGSSWCLMVQSKFDQDWGVQHDPEPALPPQTHTAASRVQQDYKVEYGGKVILAKEIRISPRLAFDEDTLLSLPASIHTGIPLSTSPGNNTGREGVAKLVPAPTSGKPRKTAFIDNDDIIAVSAPVTSAYVDFLLDSYQTPQAPLKYPMAGRLHMPNRPAGIHDSNPGTVVSRHTAKKKAIKHGWTDSKERDHHHAPSPLTVDMVAINLRSNPNKATSRSIPLDALTNDVNLRPSPSSIRVRVVDPFMGLLKEVVDDGGTFDGNITHTGTTEQQVKKNIDSNYTTWALRLRHSSEDAVGHTVKLDSGLYLVRLRQFGSGVDPGPSYLPPNWSHYSGVMRDGVLMEFTVSGGKAVGGHSSVTQIPDIDGFIDLGPTVNMNDLLGHSIVLERYPEGSLIRTPYTGSTSEANNEFLSIETRTSSLPGHRSVSGIGVFFRHTADTETNEPPQPDSVVCLFQHSAIPVRGSNITIGEFVGRQGGGRKTITSPFLETTLYLHKSVTSGYIHLHSSDVSKGFHPSVTQATGTLCRIDEPKDVESVQIISNDRCCPTLTAVRQRGGLLKPTANRVFRVKLDETDDAQCQCQLGSIYQVVGLEGIHECVVGLHGSPTIDAKLFESTLCPLKLLPPQSFDQELTPLELALVVTTLILAAGLAVLPCIHLWKEKRRKRKIAYTPFAGVDDDEGRRGSVEACVIPPRLSDELNDLPQRG